MKQTTLRANEVKPVFYCSDENRWSYKWVADDCTTFKFKDVLDEE